jgi:hypothetical protein
MASSYVNDLRLNEMATGDASGTWGTTTNTNLELIAEAFSYGTEVITTNADTHTTTIADGATDPGRSMYLKYTGTLDSACTITIGPNTVSKVWIIENGTSGSQNIILSQGSGANITIPAGDTKVVYSDGAGAGAAFFDAFASLSVVDLKVQDDLTVTGDIDVDGTTNLDVVDIDGAVDMASTLTVAGDANFDSNTLFVDSSANSVGIGTTSPNISGFSKALTIDSSESGIELSASGTVHALIASNTQGANIQGIGSSGIRMFTSASGSATERFRIASDGSLSTPTLGTSNVRFGVNAGNSITSGGNYNTVVGDQAGTAITTGDN